MSSIADKGPGSLRQWDDSSRKSLCQSQREIET